MNIQRALDKDKKKPEVLANFDTDKTCFKKNNVELKSSGNMDKEPISFKKTDPHHWIKRKWKFV